MKPVIGIDIGGTKTAGVVWDGKKILNELTIITPKTLLEFERHLLKLVDFLSTGRKIGGVGIGIAGQVDNKKGVVGHSPNMPFIKNLKLANFFRVNGINNVKIDNDASGFTRGEMNLGQGKKFKNFIGLTLGTGVGGGIVINRQLYRGLNNSGAELGHAVIGDEFFEAAFRRLRDKRDYKQAGKLIGKALASYINIFAPEAIIIGGGFGRNEQKKYLPAANIEIKKYLFNKKINTKILISKLNNAGALGAALLVI